ncbi:FAD_binding_3 domain-containing protein [Hyphomicrobiales bacterium]|nr:FAD_binding_3 domain-containing protein [Hyphomicrobiales bacterium]CAH1691418.1 FAD_binding_3 domain-containing protein [Hyphomicrobiales bacterium]
MQRHAEIAGGGIGGLALGMMLARNGWSVRVHERSPAIRELGAGIYLKNNSISVFEHYGIFDRIRAQGTMLDFARIRNVKGKLMQQRTLTGTRRYMALPRQTLVDTLALAAREAGVDIELGSVIAAADPTGALITESGKRLAADLVVGADGVHSCVRSSLNLGRGYRSLDTIINRYLIPSRAFTQEAVTTEHWSGNRRIGIAPAGDHSYAYLVMPRKDSVATRLPLQVETWARSHPRLRNELEIFAAAEASQYPYGVVHCPKWTAGKVAIIGDAAHGLPPTLGQGAGLTLMNAHALATIVTASDTVEAGLVRWESTVRRISDQTQRWALRYDSFTRQWPETLGALRPVVVWAFGYFSFLNDRMRIADKGLDLAEFQAAIR